MILNFQIIHVRNKNFPKYSGFLEGGGVDPSSEVTYHFQLISWLVFNAIQSSQPIEKLTTCNPYNNRLKLYPCYI